MLRTQMATPKVDALRERILDSALRQFAQNGFGGTSVQRIADDVRVSKQLLLYHFGTKGDLRSAVIDRVIDRWRELLPTLAAASQRDGADLEGTVRGLIEAFTGAPEVSQFVLRELMTPDSDLAERLRGAFAPPVWTGMTAADSERDSTTLELTAVGLLAITAIHHLDPAMRDRYLSHIESVLVAVARRSASGA